MRLHRSFTALLGLVALAACEKNAVRDITGPLPDARIMFFNFALNSPATHLYADDTKVTANVFTVCSAAANPPVTANDSLCATAGRQSTLGIGYGGVASGGLYAGLNAGTRNIQARLSADQSTVVSSAQATIQQGKHYSYYASGVYTAASQSADGFLVEDNLSATINWNVASVRLVNAISNSQAMTLYATNTETGEQIAVGGSVAYKSASEFVELAPGSYDLSTRTGAAGANLIVRTGVSFEPGRSYTIGARGDMTVTSATAVNRPFLDFATNR